MPDGIVDLGGTPNRRLQYDTVNDTFLENGQPVSGGGGVSTVAAATDFAGLDNARFAYKTGDALTGLTAAAALALLFAGGTTAGRPAVHNGSLLAGSSFVHYDETNKRTVIDPAGGTTPLNTGGTGVTLTTPATFSVRGSLAAHVANGEHLLTNDWVAQNTFAIYNYKTYEVNAGAYSAMRVLGPPRPYGGGGGDPRTYTQAQPPEVMAIGCGGLGAGAYNDGVSFDNHVYWETSGSWNADTYPKNCNIVQTGGGANWGGASSVRTRMQFLGSGAVSIYGSSTSSFFQSNGPTANVNTQNRFFFVGNAQNDGGVMILRNSGAGTNSAQTSLAFHNSSSDERLLIGFEGASGKGLNASTYAATKDVFKFMSRVGNTFSEAGNFDAAQNFCVGAASRAADATGGFPYVPTIADTPSGTPTAKTGRVPLAFEVDVNKLWIHNGTGWVGVTLS